MMFVMELLEWGFAMSDINKINQNIITMLSNVEQVESIFSKKDNDKYKYFIFVTVSKYDNELMQKIYENELKIEDKYDIKFDFRYVPAFIDKEDILPQDYKCIFTRKSPN